jgi:hypothetical protein
MLREMRPSELGLWLALHRVNPWGETRADLRAGIVASVVANANRDRKKKPQPFRPVDFMSYIDPAEVEAGDQRELQKRLLAAFGLKLDPKKARKRKS